MNKSEELNKTANDAKNFVKPNLESEKLYESLIKLCSNAVHNGKFHVFYYLPISEEVLIKLNSEGFIIDTTDMRNELTHKISWDK